LDTAGLCGRPAKHAVDDRHCLSTGNVGVRIQPKAAASAMGSESSAAAPEASRSAPRNSLQMIYRSSAKRSGAALSNATGRPKRESINVSCFAAR